MKKFWPALSVALILAGAWLLPKINFSYEKILGSEGRQEASVDQMVDFEFNDQKLSFYYYKVDDAAKITLLPNFEEKLNLKEAAEANSCEFIVSAGFYNTDDSPIGLFVAEGKTLKNYSPNNLFNAIYSINYLGTPRITTDLPADPLRIALQSGPILIENAQKSKLSLASDKPARRVIVATTGENKTFFIVVLDEESNFGGPNLSDLPQMLEIFEAKTGIALADAINLDGGTASGVWDGEFYLSNASPIGSFLCVKN